MKLEQIKEADAQLADALKACTGAVAVTVKTTEVK